MQKTQKNTQREAQPFEPGNIVRVEAKSNYCKIYFINSFKTVVVSKVLHLVQENLPADMFVRVHRSHLVNRLYIKQFSGIHTRIVELTNGEFVAVSRRKHAMIHKINQE
jgi:two-component system LytT family response regulator